MDKAAMIIRVAIAAFTLGLAVPTAVQAQAPPAPFPTNPMASPPAAPPGTTFPAVQSPGGLPATSAPQVQRQRRFLGRRAASGGRERGRLRGRLRALFHRGG
jgi:hypothetical protein